MRPVSRTLFPGWSRLGDLYLPPSLRHLARSPIGPPSRTIPLVMHITTWVSAVQGVRPHTRLEPRIGRPARRSVPEFAFCWLERSLYSAWAVRSVPSRRTAHPYELAIREATSGPEIHQPDRRREQPANPPGRGRAGAAGAVRARLPRALVLMAPPAVRARRRRLPRGRGRPTRLRPLVQAAAHPRLSDHRTGGRPGGRCRGARRDHRDGC